MTPTPEQVTRFTSELHRKFDHISGMKARIDRGAALAMSGDVYPTQSGYMVLSSRNDGTGYTVSHHGYCTCPDANNPGSKHGPLIVRGIPACKHNIAYNIHFRTLSEALAARILAHDTGGHQQQRIYANTYLLILPPHKGSKPALWSDLSGILAHVSWSTPLNAWIPVTPADMIAIEEWLDQAQDLPGNALVDLAIATAVNHYEQTHADAPTMPAPVFRQWLETGELPAYQSLDQTLAH